MLRHARRKPVIPNRRLERRQKRHTATLLRRIHISNDPPCGEPTDRRWRHAVDGDGVCEVFRASSRELVEGHGELLGRVPGEEEFALDLPLLGVDAVEVDEDDAGLDGVGCCAWGV